jgi:hypothetical protein
MFDARVIDGQPAWARPLKFSASLLLYGGTFTWMSGFVQNRRRWLSFCSQCVLVGTFAELCSLFAQTLRGASVHANFTTALDATLWCVVTFSILPVALSAVLLFGLLLLEKNLPSVIGLSVRLALWLMLIGLIPGMVMLVPQLCKLIAAHFPDMSAAASSLAHQFAANESPACKDKLRAAHFIGLHALQILPTAAYLVIHSRPCSALSEHAQRTIVWTAAIILLDAMAALICLAPH